MTVKVKINGKKMNKPKKINIAKNIEKIIKSLITLLLFLFSYQKMVDNIL